MYEHVYLEAPSPCAGEVALFANNRLLSNVNWTALSPFSILYIRILTVKLARLGPAGPLQFIEVIANATDLYLFVQFRFPGDGDLLMVDGDSLIVDGVNQFAYIWLLCLSSFPITLSRQI